MKHTYEFKVRFLLAKLEMLTAQCNLLVATANRDLQQFGGWSANYTECIRHFQDEQDCIVSELDAFLDSPEECGDRMLEETEK